MKILKKILVISILFFILFLLSVPHYSGDVWNHLVWGKSIASEGTYEFYNRTFKDIAFPNYPPLAMFLFTVSFLIYKLTLGLFWFLNQNISFFPSNLIYFIQSNNVQIAFLKIPTILALLILNIIVYKITPKLFNKSGYEKAILTGMFSTLNPALFYLSVIWGQIDLIPVIFLLLSSYFLFDKKIYLTSLFASLALLTKQTIIIFWLIEIMFMIRILGVKKTILSSLVTLLLVYFSYIPFLGVNPLNVVDLYRANFTYVAQVSHINSINLWGFIYDFQVVPDNRLFLGYSYNLIGKILFMGTSIPVLLFIFLTKLNKYKKQMQFYVLIYTFFVVTLLYFLFLTRMHERYLIPAVIFSTILIFYRKFHYLNLIFFSLLVFINLYRGLLEPEIPFLKNLVFSTSILGIFFLIYFLLTFYNIILLIRTLNNSKAMKI